MKRTALVQGTMWCLCTLILVQCTRTPVPATVPSPTVASVSPSQSSPTPTPQQDSFLEARLAMVRDQIERRGISDPAVLEAMRTVPRHLFVPDQWQNQAYADHPLPIGYNQTISQPYIVAWMTELLQLDKDDRVLEIGTGSGYQAAILAELGLEVYTLEIVEALATQAAERLAGMGYSNIAVQHRDGYYGWDEKAPFDGIIVTCAPDHIPTPLVQQLREGGRMVVPVGPPGGYQSLFLITKTDGKIQSHNLGGVSFVPLTR